MVEESRVESLLAATRVNCLSECSASSRGSRDSSAWNDARIPAKLDRSARGEGGGVRGRGLLVFGRGAGNCWHLGGVDGFVEGA